MRIIQVANFYGPRSGGLRTALHHLGAGYVRRGHEVVLIVPGSRARSELLANGARRITLPAPRLPGTGGYRAVDPWRVYRLLEQLRPDAIEVSDRLSLRGLGGWAARRGVPSVVISHERLDRLLAQFLLPTAVSRRVADRANRAQAAGYDTVVCTTGFARVEFDRVGARNVVQVPLGVDLATFSPGHRDPRLRRALAAGASTLLVHCGRLSVEKHPERSIDTVAALCAAGHDVRLVVAGDGPRRAALQRRAAGLPVRFLGFLPDRLTPGPAAGLGRCPARSRPARDVRAVRAGGAGLRHTGAMASSGRPYAGEQFGWPATVGSMLEVLAGAGPSAQRFSNAGHVDRYSRCADA